MAEVKIVIRAVNKFKGELRKIGRDLKWLGGVAKSIGHGISWAFKRIAVGIGAVIGVSALLVREYMKEQAAEQALADALRAHGDNVDELMPKLMAFAAQMHGLTTATHEEVQAAMALGRNLGITTGNLESATQAAMGLAQITGGTLESAMRLIAQAVQGNTSRLARYIPELRRVKDETDRLAVVQAVASRGFVQAMARTTSLAGRLTQLRKAIGEASERFGLFVVESLRLPELLDRIRNAVERVMARLEKSGALDRWAAKVRGVVDLVARGAEMIAGGGEDSGRALAAMGNVIKAIFVDAANAALGVFVSSLPSIAKAIHGIMGGGEVSDRARAELLAENAKKWSAMPAWKRPFYGTEPSRADVRRRVNDIIAREGLGTGVGGATGRALAGLKGIVGGGAPIWRSEKSVNSLAYGGATKPMIPQVAATAAGYRGTDIEGLYNRAFNDVVGRTAELGTPGNPMSVIVEDVAGDVTGEE